jgi:hypothetical protein
MIHVCVLKLVLNLFIFLKCFFCKGMEYEILEGMASFMTSTMNIEVAVVEVSHITVYKVGK